MSGVVADEGELVAAAEVRLVDADSRVILGRISVGEADVVRRIELVPTAFPEDESDTSPLWRSEHSTG